MLAMPNAFFSPFRFQILYFSLLISASAMSNLPQINGQVVTLVKHIFPIQVNLPITVMV